MGFNIAKKYQNLVISIIWADGWVGGSKSCMLLLYASLYAWEDRFLIVQNTSEWMGGWIETGGKSRLKDCFKK